MRPFNLPWQNVTEIFQDGETASQFHCEGQAFSHETCRLIKLRMTDSENRDSRVGEGFLPTNEEETRSHPPPSFASLLLFAFKKNPPASVLWLSYFTCRDNTCSSKQSHIMNKRIRWQGPRGNNSSKKEGMDQQGPVRGMRGMWVIDHCHTLIHILQTHTNASEEGGPSKRFTCAVGKPSKYVKVESSIWYGGKEEGKEEKIGQEQN